MILSRLLALSFVSIALATPIKQEPSRLNVMVTNDDGWATEMIRAEFDALDKTGKYNMLLSCPAVDKSGTANTTATPTVTTAPCEFNTCPVGAPAIGHDAKDPRLNYVNAFPVDSVSIGITETAPKIFHGQKPDFTVAGSNIGLNLGETCLQISGTCHAAAQSVKMGIPAVAFSAFGPSLAFVSYTDLESEPQANFTIAAEIYSALSVKVVDTLLAPFTNNNFNVDNKGHSEPGLGFPPRVVPSINYPATANCSRVEDFKFVFTRMLPATENTKDVELCGNHGKLTDENTAFQVPGCWATISVYDAINWNDVDAKTQEFFADRLKPILSCQNKH